MVAHRRAGKTVAVINDLIRDACRSKLQAPRFAYVAPIFAQAKDTAWTYLKFFTSMVPGAVPHEAELRVDFKHNGGRVRLYGAENYDRMRGIYLDGVGVDEYGDMDPRAWQEVLRPALSDREGWATFIGTPKGTNHFEEKSREAELPGWFKAVLKASETGIIPQKELDDARRAMSKEQYEQEYECSFLAGIVGAFYSEAMQKAEDDKRIGDVPFDKTLDVHTWWDLGIDDATAIWFMQRARGEVRLIDYYENSGVGLEHYTKMLREKHEQRGYVYPRRGGHWLPHDIKVEELSSGMSRFAYLRSLGLNILPSNVAPKWSLEDGINASRTLLAKCWFDKMRCERGIQALRNYKREWNNKLLTFKEQPRHDWASHGADAFRTGAVVWKENPTFVSPEVAESYDPMAAMAETQAMSARIQARYAGTKEEVAYDPFEHQ